MTNVLHLNAIKRQENQSYEGYISPDYLQDFIPPCETRVITFHSKKAMNSYRSMLYTINRQGQFRYRTMRDENSAWGIIIWRMK